MARPQSPPILAQLRSAATVPEQAAALRALKNDIVGHVQKKEQWISLGVLEPIVRTILPDRPYAKLNGKGPHGGFCSRPLSEDETAKLQALQLLASFAHGGPAFLAPISAGRALPGILSNVSPFTNPPQIVTASLRALVDIADAAALTDSTAPLNTQTLAEKVFASTHLDAFNAILSTTSPKVQSQTQIALVCDLIRKICREDKIQHALTMAGILDTLAARLASFAVADGYVIPGAALAAQEDGLFEAFPDPAPDSAKLGPILEAISAVVGESKYRANRLVCAPAILAVFPSIRFEPPRWFQDIRADLGYPGTSESRGLDLSAMEYVLPAIPYPSPHPYPSSRSTSAPHSAIGTPDRSESQVSSRNSHSRTLPRTMWDTETRANNSDSEKDDVESPLVPWLIHLVRSRTDDERLMAASVLTSLYKAGLGSKTIREVSIGLLVVPLLVDMIVKNEPESEKALGAKGPSKRQMILEHAPVVLARLIIDCEYLQKAAFDCKAIKALVKILRKSYTPSEASVKGAMWSPYPDTDMDAESPSPISQLGAHGHDVGLAHHIRLREAALKAIGALAAGKEDYRKALVAEDHFVSHVVESLSEFPRKPRPSAKERGKDKSTPDDVATTVDSDFGRNPLSVIIAACHLVRMLSRSISILRTSLVDFGVALPVLQFLKHPDVNVQNAATATMANLVVEVSPVRELLTEKGAMAILCEHAHSDNPSLRLNALWALKHLVDAVGPDLKKSCLEELEPGWLVQLIRDDTQLDTVFSNGGGKNSPSMDMDEDVDLGESVDEQHRWTYGVNGEIKELDAANSTRMRQAEDKLAAVRETELNPARKARNDNVAIQEQGLNFIRNFIGHGNARLSSEPSETAEMIDHLFAELGQDHLFDILASKLRPKHLHPFSRRAPTAGREARVIYPQAQIIVPTIYVLVHMSASELRHRQLVITQTELLKTLAAQTSKDREVRVALCHLVTNLTWQDVGEDAETVKQRALELKKLGFYTKMQSYRTEERELDVKERAKNAVAQMDAALQPPSGF